MGFEQFLWYAENMLRNVQFELRLGVVLGLMRYDEVEQFISRYGELIQRIRCMHDGSQLFKHGPVH